MAKSIVAGIVDRNGNLNRVVVTAHESLHFHVNAGEQFFIVPRLRVQEPVSWQEVPDLIKTVEDHIERARRRLTL